MHSILPAPKQGLAASQIKRLDHFGRWVKGDFQTFWSGSGLLWVKNCWTTQHQRSKLLH